MKKNKSVISEVMIFKLIMAPYILKSILIKFTNKHVSVFHTTEHIIVADNVRINNNGICLILSITSKILHNRVFVWVIYDALKKVGYQRISHL